jgi:hypothetical protein
LARRVKTQAKSKSAVEYIPYEKAYEKGIISKQEYGKFFSLDWSEENYASAKEAGRDVFNKANIDDPVQTMASTG